MNAYTVMNRIMSGTLNEWQKVADEYATLARDLVESRKATEAAQANGEWERSQVLTQLDRSGETVLMLTAKLADQQSATRRCCGQQAQLVKALRELVDTTVVLSEHRNGEENYAMFRLAVQHAHEVLTLTEVPFG